MTQGSTDGTVTDDEQELRGAFAELGGVADAFLHGDEDGTAPDAAAAPSERARSGAAPSDARDAQSNDGKTGKASFAGTLDEDDTAPSSESESETPAAPNDTAPPTEPWTYQTADGQTRTFDGIYTVKGESGIEGAIIEPDAFQRLNATITRAEQIERAYGDVEQRLKQTERLVEFTGADGKQYTGPDAIERLRYERASALEGFKLLGEYVRDIGKLSELLTVDQNNQLAINQHAVRSLFERMALVDERTAYAVRRELEQARSGWQQEAQQATERQGAVTTLWQSAEQAWGKEFPHLTAEDKTFLSQQLPRYLRAPSPQEVAAGVKPVGGLVLDGAFYGLMQHTAGLRAQRTTTAQTQAKADQFNQPMLQGARPPRSVPGKTPSNAPAVSSAPKEPSTYEDARRDWKRGLVSALRESA